METQALVMMASAFVMKAGAARIAQLENVLAGVLMGVVTTAFAFANPGGVDNIVTNKNVSQIVMKMGYALMVYARANLIGLAPVVLKGYAQVCVTAMVFVNNTMPHVYASTSLRGQIVSIVNAQRTWRIRLAAVMVNVSMATAHAFQGTPVSLVKLLHAQKSANSTVDVRSESASAEMAGVVSTAPNEHAPVTAATMAFANLI